MKKKERNHRLRKDYLPRRYHYPAAWHQKLERYGETAEVVHMAHAQIAIVQEEAQSFITRGIRFNVAEFGGCFA